MSEYAIHITGDAGSETATVTAIAQGGLCHVSLRYRDRVIEYGATDYFEAFSQIRLQLESQNLIPLCYGASLNVYPSGMCRDMSEGLVAYRLTRGRTPTQSDLVGIFDTGFDVIPASVAKQKEFFNVWFKSTKHK
jgi:hypothetical protein